MARCIDTISATHHTRHNAFTARCNTHRYTRAAHTILTANNNVTTNHIGHSKTQHNNFLIDTKVPHWIYHLTSAKEEEVLFKTIHLLYRSVLESNTNCDMFRKITISRATTLAMVIAFCLALMQFSMAQDEVRIGRNYELQRFSVLPSQPASLNSIFF